MAKKSINIVYAPGTGAPSKVFENELGEIWNNNKRDPNKINIGMGWYSIRDPKPGESILVVEPYCVLERDYESKYVGGFDHIFTWASKAFNSKLREKVIEIPHPTYHQIPGPGITDKWPEWSKRKNKIIFVANNKTSQHHSELYSFRLLLADMLHAQSKFKVEWYGQIPIKRDYYKGKAKNKQTLLESSKFSVCTENSYDPVFTHNYFTEKMPDVWKTGAVPIYFGCHNVNDFGLAKESYIDLREYCRKEGKDWIINKPKLLSKLEDFSAQDHQNYVNTVKNDILGTKKFYDLTSNEKTYKIILETV